MTALSTYMGTSEATELIPTELLSTFVQAYEYPVPVGLQIAWARPGRGNIPVRFPRWNQLNSGSGVPAGTKSETDVFTDVTLDFAESTITPGIVGFRLPISDESEAGAIIGVQAGAVIQAILALVDRIDSDVLSSSTSATNSTGSVSDVFTLSKMRAACAAYKALEVPPSPMGVAIALHHNGAAALLESLGSSAATMLKNPADSLAFGTQPGYLGSLFGVQIYESANVPAESTGHSNPMTPIGFQQSGLGIVMNRVPEVIPTRGDDAENRKVTYLVCSAWYGTGVTNPNRLLEVLSE